MSTITEQLKKRILVLDGAMGTMIQNANLTAEDFGGEEYEGCNEYLNVTAPHIIRAIHREYLEASADLIETNTFGATKLVLDEYGLGHLAYELNVRGAQLAKDEADRYSTPEATSICCRRNGTHNKNIICDRRHNLR